MPPMTNWRASDVVLVRFVFADETGTKLRPALIISSHDYHSQRQEIIVAAITSNVGRLFIGDCRIKDWKTAGLLAPSVATGIIRTIKQSMIARRLGKLSKTDLADYQNQLKTSLAIENL